MEILIKDKDMEHLLKALLYHSRTEEDFKFPSISRFILSEVVNGTIDYLSGHAGKVTYQNTEPRSEFDKKINEYFNKETKDSIKNLNQKVRETLIRLIELDSEDTARLCFFFIWICDSEKSVFSLPEEVLRYVEKEVIPDLSESELKDIKGVGKSMRKYINKDVDYIRKNFKW